MLCIPEAGRQIALMPQQSRWYIGQRGISSPGQRRPAGHAGDVRGRGIRITPRDAARNDGKGRAQHQASHRKSGQPPNIAVIQRQAKGKPLPSRACLSD